MSEQTNQQFSGYFPAGEGGIPLSENVKEALNNPDIPQYENGSAPSVDTNGVSEFSGYGAPSGERDPQIREANTAEFSGNGYQSPAYNPDGEVPAATTPEGAAPDEAAQITDEPKNYGRDFILSMYKEGNPDFTGDDIDDAALLDFIGSKYNDVNSAYERQTESDKILADKVANNPQLAVLLSEILNPQKYTGADGQEHTRSIGYTLARLYGDDFRNMSDDLLDDFDAGLKERELDEQRRAELERQSNENITAYIKTIDDYAAKRKMKEEAKNALMDKIEAYAGDILMGKITPEFISFIDKGGRYDRDVQEAAEAGVVEGRNQKIEAKMQKAKAVQKGGVPDLGNVSSMNERARPTRRRGSFMDGFN